MRHYSRGITHMQILRRWLVNRDTGIDRLDCAIFTVEYRNNGFTRPPDGY